MIHNFLVSFAKDLLILLASVITGVVLLLLVYQIPKEPIMNNVMESQDIFVREGIYPMALPISFSQMDNYTDALILLESSYEGTESLSGKALLNYHYEKIEDGNNVNPFYTIIDDQFGKTTEGFLALIYPRYWHGYLIIMKPLLFFFNLHQIRWINLFLQSALTVYLLYLLYHSVRRMFIPYLISYGMLLPTVISQSLQMSDIYYIAVVTSILFVKMGGTSMQENGKMVPSYWYSHKFFRLSYLSARLTDDSARDL